MSQAYQIIAVSVPLAALGGSLAVLFWLFQRHLDGRPLLPYEPRRPVPWNGAAPALILALVLSPTLLLFLSSALGLTSDTPPELHAADAAAIGASAATSSVAAGSTASVAIKTVMTATADAWTIAPPEATPAWMVWSQAGTFVLLALLFHAALAAAFGATRIDLGWPRSWAQAGRDVATGAVAFLAILAPVLGLQWTLVFVFEPETGHPLIEQLTTEHSPGFLAAAFAIAVIGAPLFEETAFRLILQGWLERVEAHARGGREITADELPELQNPAADIVVYERAAVPGGWSPILISGTLFALAHLGQGVAPASLLPLGVALGYLYQRTHRVVPVMVCHALFNAFFLLMLWLALAAGTQ